MLQHFFYPMKWNHLCLSFDYDKKYLVVIIDGHETTIDTVNPKLPDSHPPQNFWEMLNIGKDSQSFSDAFSLIGELTDFNAWSRPLSKQVKLNFLNSFDTV